MARRKSYDKEKRKTSIAPFDRKMQWQNIQNINLDTKIKYFYFNDHKVNDPPTDLFVMRSHKSALQTGEIMLGADFWLETSRYPAMITTKAALSDFYYTLLQNSYYKLDDRKDNFANIGQQMNEYMVWGTFPNKFSA